MERDIVEQARKEAAHRLADGKAALQADARRAQAGIDAEVEALANQAAARLLGRALRGSPPAA